MRKFAIHLLLLGVLFVPVLGAPSAAEILEKFLQVSEDTALETNRNAFAYLRNARTDYLDGKGATRKQTHRIYRIAPVNGEAVTTLISKNGKPVTEEDESRQNAARENGEKGRSLEVSRELLARYDFNLAPSTNIHSRPAYALQFTPRPGVDADGVFERLLNAMHGTLFIDQEEYQLAKAEIHLMKKVSFFGGIAGALEKMDMIFAQKRIEPGVWLPESSFVDFDGRKVLSDVRFRYYEICSAHRRARFRGNAD